MANQPQPKSLKRSFANVWPWLTILIVLLFVGFVRVRVMDVPLERDEGEYAYAGQLILQGIPPYELAYNMKFPGTYYAYAIGMSIFGQTIGGIHLTLLLINALTIVFVFLLARKLFSDVAGVVAAASYGVMSMSTTVQGLAAHANHFVVLFAVPATLLLLKAIEQRELRFWFFSGLLYGFAFVMKQQGVVFCAFGTLVLVWKAIVDGSILSRLFIKRLSVFVAGTSLPLAFVCLACAIAGDFPRFLFWTFIYAHWYATGVTLHTGLPYLWMHLQDTWSISVGFWIAAAIAIPVGLKRVRASTVFAALFWLFSLFGMAIGFYFRGHYFILLLPAFALLTGAGIGMTAEILHRSQCPRLFRHFPVALFIGFAGWAIFNQSSFFFRLSPVQICQTEYLGNPFMEATAVGKFLQENSRDDARVGVFGSEPEIYFYAHRHSATGYIYMYPLLEPHPAARLMQREMTEEIETNRPEYLIGVRNEASWPPHAFSRRDVSIFKWFDDYTKNNFERIAVVGLNADNQIVFLPVSELTNTATLQEAPLEIYKRIADTNDAPGTKD